MTVRAPCLLACSPPVGDTCLGIEVIFRLTDAEFRTWNPEVNVTFLRLRVSAPLTRHIVPADRRELREHPGKLYKRISRKTSDVTRGLRRSGLHTAFSARTCPTRLRPLCHRLVQSQLPPRHPPPPRRSPRPPTSRTERSRPVVRVSSRPTRRPMSALNANSFRHLRRRIAYYTVKCVASPLHNYLGNV